MKARSVNEIINSFKKRLVSIGSPLANFAPYSNTYALFRAIGSILSEQDTRLSNATEESFLLTATGRNLDRKAEDFGLYRLTGSKSKGSILVKASRDGSLLKGTILNTASNAIQFEVISDINYKAGEVVGRVQAISNGSLYNLQPGTKLYSSTYDVDITVGYSRDPITGNALGSLEGGGTAETDEEFRTRILSSIRKKDRYLGTSNSIKEELLKLPYVTKVFILNHKPVSGYFTVYVDNRDSKNLNYIGLIIESIKPVGSLFILKPLSINSLSIRIEGEFSSSSEETRSLITETAYDYVNNLSIGQTFSVAELQRRLYQINSRVKLVSPTVDIKPDTESLLSISSIRVLI
jgi:uncharacterized phage protein gp47/JayE